MSSTTINCDACGVPMTGEDRESLITAMVDHFNEAHPQWGLGRVEMANYADALERLSGSTERLEKIGAIEVHRVTPERIPDVLDYFDHDAFAGNPGWAVCYCTFYHQDDPEMNGKRPWEVNRAEMESRLRDGSMVGYLAYVDGKPAGWCNASPRSSYPTRRTGKDDDEVGVAVCFVIAPPYRRHGLARHLLKAAIEGFRERGTRRVEGHPVLGTDTDAPNYHGPLSLFLEEGFAEVERDERTALVAKDL